MDTNVSQIRADTTWAAAYIIVDACFAVIVERFEVDHDELVWCEPPVILKIYIAEPLGRVEDIQ